MNRSGLFKKILSTAIKLLTAVIAVPALLALFIGITGNQLTVFGTTVLRVVSESMAPEFHTGDFIVIESCDASSLREGDIISFRSSDPSIAGSINTHRVISVNSDGSFTTGGDSNPMPDLYNVNPENIIGRYVRVSRFFNFFSSFFSSPLTFALLILIPGVLVLIIESTVISDFLKERKITITIKRVGLDPGDRELRALVEKYGESAATAIAEKSVTTDNIGDSNPK